MSQHRTVTCLISPGRISPGTQIGAGRGSYRGTAAESRSPRPSNGVPHPPQNRFSGALTVPHDRHANFSGAPHSPQNFIPARLSASHREHLMPRLRKRATGWCVNATTEPNPKLSAVQLFALRHRGSLGKLAVRQTASSISKNYSSFPRKGLSGNPSPSKRRGAARLCVLRDAPVRRSSA